MKDGICFTCTKRHTCTFPSLIQPILQCDEYDGESTRPTAHSTAGKTNVKVEPLQSDSSLCVTCSIRTTCTYPSSSKTLVLECADYC